MAKVDTTGNGRARRGQSEVATLLNLISRHAGLIGQALHGPVQIEGQGVDTGVEALVNARVLLPYDENAYYLNPQLRNFINESLNHFFAAEQFTRVSGTIKNIRRLCNQIAELQRQGEIADAERIVETLDFEVIQLMHTYERNLNLFHSQLSTDYGNVASLKAKLLQNDDYQRQVKEMLGEGVQVVALLESVSQYARGEVMQRARQMILSRISALSSSWAARLNDVQSVISKRRFANRELAKQVLNLSNAAKWLARNPTVAGIDMQFGSEVDPLLLGAQSLRVRPQVDVADVATAVEIPMQKVLQRLPPAQDPFQLKPEKSKERLVRKRQMEVHRAQIGPLDRAILELAQTIAMPSAQPISLLQWQRQVRADEGIGDEAWLLYAMTQLGAKKIQVRYERRPRRPGVYNSVFSDIVALPQAPRG